MHLSTRSALAFLPLLTLLTGCGASGPSRPAVEFPTRAEVAELPSKKAPIAVFGTTDAHADEWAFEAARAGQAAAAAPATPWGRDPPPTSPSRRSQAHAIGHALRVRRAGRRALPPGSPRRSPGEELRRFTIARCAASRCRKRHQPSGRPRCRPAIPTRRSSPKRAKHSRRCSPSSRRAAGASSGSRPIARATSRSVAVSRGRRRSAARARVARGLMRASAWSSAEPPTADLPESVALVNRGDTNVRALRGRSARRDAALCAHVRARAGRFVRVDRSGRPAQGAHAALVGGRSTRRARERSETPSSIDDRGRVGPSALVHKPDDLLCARVVARG